MQPNDIFSVKAFSSICKVSSRVLCIGGVAMCAGDIVTIAGAFVSQIFSGRIINACVDYEHD